MFDDHVPATSTAAFESSVDETQSDGGWNKLQESLKNTDEAPSRLGRFVVIGRLGQGGMGVVYSAYDPQLDRRVALKLVRARGSSRARDRLLREAQALARLSHPNVVPVHDVGVLANTIFVVMEFVAGQNLRRWVEASPRSWREILAIYRQAGEGLAAAHAVELVHRDFKPDNAVIGEDGRLRVLDFGLAHRRPGGGGDTPTSDIRPAPDDSVSVGLESTLSPEQVGGEHGAARAGQPATEGVANRLLGAPLTRTGAILGTPAYMPPEQLLGQPAGPAADQFSFCVSLYEALYGQRPFAGSEIGELASNVLAGNVREPPGQRDVPPWLERVLLRGLRPEPDDRYPSMQALLAALDRDPARTWRRWLLALLVAVAASVAIYALTRPPPPVEPCTGSAAELADVWNDTRRLAIDQTLRGTGLPYAEEASPLVLAGLDRYADAWIAMHHGACMAHQRGHESGALLDRRMRCLDGRRSALDSTIQVLGETDADGLTSTVDAVQKLPSLAYCANAEALEAEVAPPEDPAVAAQLAGLRERLTRLQARNHAGRYTQVADQAKALISDATELGYRPFLAEVLLAQGHAYQQLVLHGPASETLHQAMIVGLETGMNAVAVEALARRIHVDGMGSDAAQNAALHAYIEIAEPLARSLPDRTFVLGMLLNNIGSMHFASDDRDAARDYLQRAYAVKRSAPEPDPVELSEALLNLSLVAEDSDQRAALLAQSARESALALGPAHPSTLLRHRGYGQFVRDPQEALTIIRGVCDLRKQHHPTQLASLSLCQFYLAMIYIELEQPELAVAEFTDVANRELPGDMTSIVFLAQKLGRGYSEYYRGNYAQASNTFDTLISKHTLADKPSWFEFWTAQMHLGAGLSNMKLGESRAGIAFLDSALASFVRVARFDQRAVTQRLLARTQVALGQALFTYQPDEPGSRTRAASLLETAMSWYRNAGTSYHNRVQELEQWRRESL